MAKLNVTRFSSHEKAIAHYLNQIDQTVLGMAGLLL